VLESPASLLSPLFQEIIYYSILIIIGKLKGCQSLEKLPYKIFTLTKLRNFLLFILKNIINTGFCSTFSKCGQYNNSFFNASIQPAFKNLHFISQKTLIQLKIQFAKLFSSEHLKMSIQFKLVSFTNTKPCVTLSHIA
jgi:hypothetical protein